jgi:glucose-6-phosphate 1-epimerase
MSFNPGGGSMRAPAMGVCLGMALVCITTPLRAQPAPLAFSDCIERLRTELPRHPRVRAASFERYARSANDLRPIISASVETQPEFKLPIWDYLARLVDAQRVADGQALLKANEAPLRAIADRHGVDLATVIAVYGVETDYGRVGGKYGVVDATASRACLDLKSKERKAHFFTALWLLQEGLVADEAFRGSWAGAFGLTQFMPATFAAYMDDGDGSGTVDIIGSELDALATTARYIAAMGSSSTLRWGVEVNRPADGLRELIASEQSHGCLAASARVPGKCRSVEQWVALGVTSVTAGMPIDLPSGTRAALLAPAGEAGPAWLVTRSYQAIWQYNRADAYGLAIGLLGDALGGRAPMRAPWPTDDPGLSRAELLQLQRELIRVGYGDVVADGFDGPRTRDAIRQEERRRGWPETGRAGSKIAQLLLAAPAPEGASSGANSPPTEVPTEPPYSQEQ